MKAVSRFQPGEGPSRGLLRDCTTSPIKRLHSSSKYSLWTIIIVIQPSAQQPMYSQFPDKWWRGTRGIRYGTPVSWLTSPTTATTTSTGVSGSPYVFRTHFFVKYISITSNTSIILGNKWKTEKNGRKRGCHEVKQMRL